jgi:hypothetical protein
LYNFRARDYDSRTGTFLSRDPVDPTEQDPEALNPYQAMYNNPYVYTDPTGMFSLAELNAGQSIQNTLKANLYNSFRQRLIDKAQGVVTDVLMGAAQNLLANMVPGGSFFDTVLDIASGDPSVTGQAGAMWERMLTDAVCNTLLGDNQKYTQNLWIQPRVSTKGQPTRNGLNCGGYQYTKTGRVSSKGVGGTGPMPDFIIKEGGPSATDHATNSTYKKAYLIGDIKSTWETVGRAVGEKQWDAITNYAKYSNRHQYVPTALYVTAIGGKESTHQKIVNEGLKNNVFVYLLTMIPDLKR